METFNVTYKKMKELLKKSENKKYPYLYRFSYSISEHKYKAIKIRKKNRVKLFHPDIVKNEYNSFSPSLTNAILKLSTIKNKIGEYVNAR